MSETEKDKKHRSPAYPFIPLKKALERARKLYERNKRHSTPLAVAAGLTAGLELRYAGLCLAFALYLAVQAVRVRTDDPALALKLFKSNAWAGLMLFVAIAAVAGS